jgi:hypothetical protein
VLILGLGLLVIGFIANMAILEMIGIISPVIGVVLWIRDRWDARTGLGRRRRWCQRVMATLRALVSAARPKVS